jgi:hypothetical protein
VNEKKPVLWTPKSLLALYSVTMLFIVAICGLAVWLVK